MNRFPKNRRARLLATAFGNSLALSAAASAGDSCPGDFDFNGAVDFGDILYVVAQWGACPTGSMTPEYTGSPIGEGNDLRYLHAADLDGDGDQDLIAGGTQSSWWYQRDGAAFTRHLLPSSLSTVTSIQVADLDGDGDLDVLESSFGGITWYENDGASMPSFTGHGVAAGGSIEIEVADVNGDGTPDVVAEHSGTTRLYLNLSNGFGAPALIDLGDIAQLPAYDYAVGDIDGDGDADILMNSGGYQADDPLLWLENDGNSFPTFEPREIDFMPTFRSCALADVDGDGDLDALAGASYEAAWYENDGAATPGFAKHVLATSEASTNVRTIEVADLDNDGDADITMSPAFAGEVSWFENDGSSNFNEHGVSSEGGWATAVRPADMDGDGDLDLVASDAVADNITWYENHIVEPCPADGDLDGNVGMLELMYLIQVWGPCP